MTFMLAFLAVGVAAGAQETDTLATGQKKSERNMLLNAESASAPREINIGLPESGGGAKVYVDGMAHGISLPAVYRPEIFIKQAIVAFIMVTIASIIPALFVSRQDPAQALRSN